MPAALTLPMTLHLPAPPPLARDASLFLDFDGTLVDFAVDPEAVSVDAELAALLTTLSDRLDSRLALVSGRPAGQLRALVGESAPLISGSHGVELIDVDGTLTAPERHEKLAAVQAAMERFAANKPGVLIEVKPFGVALHYRADPGQEVAARALAAELAAQAGLSLQPGKMMAEVRDARVGADKGVAIAMLMERAPFASGRPVFVGDDDTDEAGFAAVARLGGAGVLVGPARSTTAAFRLPDISAVLAWLGASA